jgi:hypothetical protein
MCYAWGEGGSAARAPFFPHFFIHHFFISSTSHRRIGKKNTRTSTVAAVTSSPRFCFFIFHYESGLVLKIVFEKNNLVRFFFHFFIFHFRALRTKEMEQKTRAHQWRRLQQACHVFAFIFFLFGNAIYHIFVFPNCFCTRALLMCFHSYMCKDLAHSSQFTPPKTMLAPRRHTLFLSFAAHSLHPPSPLSFHA